MSSCAVCPYGDVDEDGMLVCNMDAGLCIEDYESNQI